MLTNLDMGNRKEAHPLALSDFYKDVIGKDNEFLVDPMPWKRCVINIHTQESESHFETKISVLTNFVDSNFDWSVVVHTFN